MFVQIEFNGRLEVALFVSHDFPNLNALKWAILVEVFFESRVAAADSDEETIILDLNWLLLSADHVLSSLKFENGEKGRKEHVDLFFIHVVQESVRIIVSVSFGLGHFRRDQSCCLASHLLKHGSDLLVHIVTLLGSLGVLLHQLCDIIDS